MTNIPPSGPHSEAQPPRSDAKTVGAPALAFNPDNYRSFLAEGGLTRPQEDALLNALWLVVVGFVDLGFGIHPVQQANASVNNRRGKLEPDSAGMVVFCTDTFRENADNVLAAAPDTGAAAGRKDS